MTLFSGKLIGKTPLIKDSQYKEVFNDEATYGQAVRSSSVSVLCENSRHSSEICRLMNLLKTTLPGFFRLQPERNALEMIITRICHTRLANTFLRIKMEERITLIPVKIADVADFKSELQKAFSVAIVDKFEERSDEPIPSDKTLDMTMNATNAVSLHILCNGRKVGGAVLNIDNKTHHNSLDLFFLMAGEEGRGIGLKAWHLIEEEYPETVSWQTHTPYFEKRNIHFYVNKCGFKIVEFFNKKHPDINHPEDEVLLEEDKDAFRFEKVMRESDI